MSKPAYQKNMCKVMKCKKPKFLYDILNSNTFVTTGKRRWNDILDIEDMHGVENNPYTTFYKNKKL